MFFMATDRLRLFEHDSTSERSRMADTLYSCNQDGQRYVENTDERRIIDIHRQCFRGTTIRSRIELQRRTVRVMVRSVFVSNAIGIVQMFVSFYE